MKTVGKFSYAIVRGAGHIAPYDQPRPMNDLIDKFNPMSMAIEDSFYSQNVKSVIKFLSGTM